jgi:hypothetical protein
MKNLAFAVACSCIALLNAGCHIACKDGHGPVRSEVREVRDFDGVHLNLTAEVTVRQGHDYAVEVEAEDNLQDEIRTIVRGHTLHISSDQCLKPNIKIKVRVSMPEIGELEINGSGDIRVPDTAKVQRLDLVINGTGNIECRLIASRLESTIRGSGDIRLAGSANEQEIRVLGSGDVNAMQLPCNSAEVRVSGSGDVHVYVIKDLDIRVTGSGDVFYKGKPALKTRVNGSGKVVDKNS